MAKRRKKRGTRSCKFGKISRGKRKGQCRSRRKTRRRLPNDLT